MREEEVATAAPGICFFLLQVPPVPPVSRYLLVWASPGTFVPHRIAFLLRPRSLFPLDSLAWQFISQRPRAGSERGWIPASATKK